MTQTVTAQELMSESPSTVKDIIDLILADTVTIIVNTELGYKLQFSNYFSQCGLDVVELYKTAKEDLDLSAEYLALHPLVEQVIDNIGADLFTDMLDTDENSAYSEVLRCFGHGVSFWDNHDYKDFGFFEMPRLKTTLEHPYDIATQILDKIAEAHPELVGDDEEETEPDNVTTYQIPTIYLPLIFNADATGLEDEDIELFDEFIEREGLADNKGYWSYPDNQESYFSHVNDVTRLGNDVIDLQWANTSTQDNDFDIWLSQNYIPAGEDASNGGQWYLSANPNELRHIYYSEDKVLMRSSSGHPITLHISEERIIVDTETDSRDFYNIIYS